MIGRSRKIQALKRTHILCERGCIDFQKKSGIDSLYDNFEIDRGNTLKVFEAVGFKIIKYQT